MVGEVPRPQLAPFHNGAVSADQIPQVLESGEGGAPKRNAFDSDHAPLQNVVHDRTHLCGRGRYGYWRHVDVRLISGGAPTFTMLRNQDLCSVLLRNDVRYVLEQPGNFIIDRRVQVGDRSRLLFWQDKDVPTDDTELVRNDVEVGGLRKQRFLLQGIGIKASPTVT